MNLLFIYFVLCLIYPPTIENRNDGACKTPGIPAGASFEPMRNGYDVRDIIRYKCSEQSLIFGTTKRICLQSGEWSSQSPFCVKPTNLVANVTYISSLGSRTTTEVSDRNPISCSGNRSLRDGKTSWTAFLERDSQVLGIKLLMSQGMAEVHLLDSFGSGIACETRNPVVSKDNFKWKIYDCSLKKQKSRAIRINPVIQSPEIPQLCELEIFVKEEPENMCDMPPIISPGSKWDLNDLLGEFEPGDKATFSCNPNYRLEGDETLIRCLPNGRWTTVVAKCIKITCATSMLDKVPGGEWIPVGEETDHEIQTTKTLICKKGFDISGDNHTVICTDKGTWTANTALCSRIETVEDIEKGKLGEAKVQTITYVIGGFVIGCCVLIIMLCIYKKCKIEKKKERILKKTSLYGLSTYEVHRDNDLYI